jgi:uncharacterized membrane protein YhaH (DUF805 family)
MTTPHNYDASQPPSVQAVADHPLSPRGRFARLAYLAWYLVITLIISIVAVLGIAVFGNTGNSADPFAGIGTASILIMAVAYIVFFYYAIVFTIRRLHDINQTGWLSLLILVPLVNLIFMLYVMFAPGTRGGNNFGPQRLNQGWEKVLGIIYIILTVLGIIAGIAVFGMMGDMSGNLGNINNY